MGASRRPASGSRYNVTLESHRVPCERKCKADAPFAPSVRRDFAHSMAARANARRRLNPLESAWILEFGHPENTYPKEIAGEVTRSDRKLDAEVDGRTMHKWCRQKATPDPKRSPT